MKTITLPEFRIHRPVPSVKAAEQKPCYLVHYEGGPASLAALKLALALAAQGTEIIAVSLIAVPRSQPLNIILPDRVTQSKLVMAAAITNARMHGIEIQTDIIQCHDIGQALVARAAECGATTIFLGIQRDDFEEKLDPLAEYVLCFAPSKVVLVGL